MGGVTVTNIEDFRGALQELRMDVEAEGRKPKIVAVKGIFRQRNPAEVLTINYPPWVIGYKVKEMLPTNPGFFMRKVFIRNMDQPIEKMPEQEKNDVAYAIFDELIDRQQGEVDIECPNEFTVIFTQVFQPMLLMRPRMVRL